MKTFSFLFAVVLLPPFAAAQDPLEILKKTAKTYKSLDTFDLDLTTKWEYDNASSRNQSERRERIAGAGDRYRQETASPQLLTVFDGQFRWEYDAANNEYTKLAVQTPQGVGMPRPLPFTLDQYRQIADRVKTARILKQETVALQSGSVSCYVIEVEREKWLRADPPPGQPVSERLPDTYWIDITRGLVLKSVEKVASRNPDSNNTTTFSVTKAAVNQPVAESLFQFTPPAGAVQVERLSFIPKSAQIGKDLPDFELKGADGSSITSAGLRGNLAVIHFGPSGSVPADDTLPFVELLHRVYKGQGVAALYVTYAAAAQAELAKRGYTLRAGLDPGGAIARKIGVLPQGTVVADRTGKILHLINGSNGQTPRIIMKELQKAGVW